MSISEKEAIDILLVEDNLIAQKIAKQVLTSLGCAVDVASMGSAALIKVQHNQYDLICLDIGLPDMTGYQLIEKIRAYEKKMNRAAHVIVTLSAHTEEQDAALREQLGIKKMFVKPLTADLAPDLLAQICYSPH